MTNVKTDDEKAHDNTTAMAQTIAAALDPGDMSASARALADGFNRVFALEKGFTAKLTLSPLACFEADEQSWQNRL